MSRLFPVLVALSLLPACGPLTEEVSEDVCKSGTRWIGDDSGDSEMKPGAGCINCHSSNDGPRFAFAGTVYSDLNQETDCFGTPGVEVKIVDADGKVFQGTTNGAGNFHFGSSAPKVPYTASIFVDGAELKMMTPQSNGDCNSCHTAAGSSGAPGRIVAQP